MFTLNHFKDSHYCFWWRWVSDWDTQGLPYGGLGCPIKTPKPYYISLLWAQARRLLDCLAVLLQVASGTRDPTLGWSGILDRKVSSSILKISWSFFMFFIFFGRQLKSLGPSIWKLCSLRVCMAFLPFWTKWGILHFLPILVFSSATSTPQFGAYPSSIFQI